MSSLGGIGSVWAWSPCPLGPQTLCVRLAPNSGVPGPRRSGRPPYRCLDLHVRINPSFASPLGLHLPAFRLAPVLGAAQFPAMVALTDASPLGRSFPVPSSLVAVLPLPPSYPERSCRGRLSFPCLPASSPFPDKHMHLGDLFDTRISPIVGVGELPHIYPRGPKALPVLPKSGSPGPWLPTSAGVGRAAGGAPLVFSGLDNFAANILVLHVPGRHFQPAFELFDTRVDGDGEIIIADFPDKARYLFITLHPAHMGFHVFDPLRRWVGEDQLEVRSLGCWLAWLTPFHEQTHPDSCRWAPASIIWNGPDVQHPASSESTATTEGPTSHDISSKLSSMASSVTTSPWAWGPSTHSSVLESAWARKYARSFALRSEYLCKSPAKRGRLTSTLAPLHPIISAIVLCLPLAQSMQRLRKLANLRVVHLQHLRRIGEALKDLSCCGCHCTRGLRAEVSNGPTLRYHAKLEDDLCDVVLCRELCSPRGPRRAADKHTSEAETALQHEYDAEHRWDTRSRGSAIVSTFWPQLYSCRKRSHLLLPSWTHHPICQNDRQGTTFAALELRTHEPR